MFPLRLLVALCAAPLVAAAFTGVAHLALRGHPLYLLLGLPCVALALVTGWDIHHHFEDRGLGTLVFAAGIVLAATLLAAYVAVLGLVAPRHLCTVVEAHAWHRLSPGGEETYTYRRLACDDGRTDGLGNEMAVRNGEDTTDRYRGTRLLVAYDPNGRLPSMTVGDRAQVLWTAGAGIGTAAVTTLHIGVVGADRRRRLRRPLA
jgi:hypothetical protein